MLYGMYWLDIPPRQYNNYELSDTIEEWELTSKQKEILDIGIYIVDHKISLRQVSKEFGIPKSTIHDRIHRDLQKLSYELYKCVTRQLGINKKKYFK